MAHAYRTSTRVEAPADVVWQVLSDAACEVTLAVAQSGMLSGLTDLALGARSRELVDAELADLKAESALRTRERA